MIEHPPDQHEHAERDEDTDVRPAGTENPKQTRRLFDGGRSGDARARGEGVPYQVGGEVDGDVVHQDGDADLVHLPVRLQRAGDSPPRSGSDHCDGEAERNMDKRMKPGESVPRPRRGDGAQVELSLDADVEHGNLCGDREGKGRKHQRDETFHDAADVEFSHEGPAEELVVGFDGIVAEQQDGPRSQGKGEDDGHQRAAPGCLIHASRLQSSAGRASPRRPPRNRPLR